MNNDKNYALIQRRKELQLSQREASDQMGIERSTLAKLELGMHSPTMKTAMKILSVYHGKFEDFFSLKL